MVVVGVLVLEPEPLRLDGSEGMDVLPVLGLNGDDDEEEGGYHLINSLATDHIKLLFPYEKNRNAPEKRRN